MASKQSNHMEFQSMPLKISRFTIKTMSNPEILSNNQINDLSTVSDSCRQNDESKDVDGNEEQGKSHQTCSIDQILHNQDSGCASSLLCCNVKEFGNNKLTYSDKKEQSIENDTQKKEFYMSRDTFTDLYELMSNIELLFDSSRLDFVNDGFEFQNQIHYCNVNMVKRFTSKFIMLRFSTLTNPARLIEILTKKHLLEFKIMRIEPSCFIFLGTTSSVAKQQDSLFTVFVPKKVDQIHQYNTNFDVMPEMISERDKSHFRFTFSYTRTEYKNFEKVRRRTIDFCLPDDRLHISFLKEKFIAFHLNQIILFEYEKTKWAGKLIFTARKPKSLEAIKIILSETAYLKDGKDG